MATQTARFLDEFSRAVFQQWQQASAAAASSAAAPRFWRDAARLRTVLQDAAAKLPRGSLRSALTRDLEMQAAALGDLLAALDKAQAAPKRPKQQQPQSRRALLNEADVERALTLHDTSALAGICAAEDEREGGESGSADALEALAARFAAVLARQFESRAEQRAKCGAIARRMARAVEALVSSWAARGLWVVDAPEDEVKELAAARRALHSLAQLDAVLLSAPEEAAAAPLAAPWTAFYRPPPPVTDVADYDEEMAGVFALLAALAVYFPVERAAASDDSDSSADSDATSEDEDKAAGKRPRSPLDALDAVPMAQLAAQRVVSAAQQRGRRAQLAGGVDRAWLVRVLTRLAALPKPSAYGNADADEPAGLAADDWRAVWDCVGALYTHALAVPSALVDAADASDADAVRAVVCVRQAALFMRTQRRQTLPAVAAAAASLARAPLPRSFSKWMAEAKRQLRGKAAHEPLLSAVRQLSECARAELSDPSDQPTAGALLREANVALDKLLAMQQSYEAFLAQMAREDERAASQARRPAVEVVALQSELQAEAALEDALFFVDSAGGQADAAAASTGGNKKRSRKKQRGADKRKREE